MGAAYGEYCARVGRVIPRFKVPGSGFEGNGPPRWGQAVVAEVYMWMSAGAFAVFGWQYDANLLIRCVLVALGVSLVVKGTSYRS